MEANPFTEAPAERLPSGRHGLTPEAVAASQHGRILFAIVQAAAEKGYGATTVADVVARAGVSRRTFYEHFSSKEDCFLNAYDTGVEIVLGRMREAAAGVDTDDWRAVMRSDLEAYLAMLAEQPEFAWSLHIEVLAAGHAALERRAAIFGLFTARTKANYALARREDPSLPELPDEAFAVHTGGMDELVRECLRTRGAKALPQLVEPGLVATLALFGAR
jgi:AcrR family transcriptional regulator